MFLPENDLKGRRVSPGVVCTFIASAILGRARSKRPPAVGYCDETTLAK